MRQFVLSIRDSKAGLFGQPIFVPSVPAGRRSFEDAIAANSGNDVLRQHPEDFDLYELGEYDDVSGTFIGLFDVIPACGDVPASRVALGPRVVAFGKDYRKE